jgi:predicted regulator of Ras-like GTPase activity (Roadblock/LC7/MglB family)
MSLVEKSPDPKTISSGQGSRINGIAHEFITLSGAELVLVTTTEGALIARAGEMDTTEIEGVGMISALIYAAAQSIGTSIGTSVSYVHQHGDKKDLLLLRINGNFGLIIAFDKLLGLGGILYNARRTAAALSQILGATSTTHD